MDTYTKNEITTDVLIIGGGMAAIFAAKRAADNGASVTIVDKGSLGRSGQTPFASGMAVFDEDEGHDRDEWQRIMSENAYGLNNPAYLDQMMDYSKECYNDLLEWGATETGFGAVLRNKILAEDIEVIERTMITTLLEEDGTIAGAIGFKLDKEEAVIIKAKSVVLCTGAGGFKPSGFQICSLSFDGDAMAYRIGAKISGKEFVDTHATIEDTPAYCWGQWQGMWSMGMPRNASGPTDGGGQALDLSSYHSIHDGTSTSDTMEHGQGESLGLPPGLELPEGVEESEVIEILESMEMSEAIEKLAELGVEMPEMPGAPTGQISEGDTEGQAPGGQSEGGGPGGEAPGGESSGEGPGGQSKGGGGGGQQGSRLGGASAGLSVHKAEGLFPADNKCGTNITGLYAAGDCLSSMLVGPIYNGVIGFAISGSATQGAQAGEVAAEFTKSTSQVSVSDTKIEEAITEMFAPMNNEQGYDPAWVEHMLQGTLIPYYVLYIKHETRLNSALTNIEFYRDHFVDKLKADDLHDLRKAHEVKNMLLNAEMKLKASLFRTESRGNHYREEYPDMNDTDWLAWVVIQKGADGNMELEKFLVDDFESLVV